MRFFNYKGVTGLLAADIGSGHVLLIIEVNIILMKIEMGTRIWKLNLNKLKEENEETIGGMLRRLLR